MRSSLLRPFRLAAILLAPITFIAGCVTDDKGAQASSSDLKRTKLPSDLGYAEISSTLPLSIFVPSWVGDNAVNARPFFDKFSWQSFIALNWPADSRWPSDPAVRGVPQAPNHSGIFLGAAPGTTTVWSTYKEANELFGTGDARPSPWTSLSDPTGVCTNLPPGSKKMLMVNKGGTVLDGLNEAFSFPLIDQNLNYAWTEVRYNKEQYGFIRGSDTDKSSWLYLLRNLQPYQRERTGLQMPASSKGHPGSLMIKATWRIMTEKDNLLRYYSIPAYLYDASTQECTEARVGLVGFHIAQKLKEFPEWVWSTFEQVDNVERGPGAPAGTPISFNNGTDNPKTVGGFANRPRHKAPPLLPRAQRTAVQVTRLNPIPDTPDWASTRYLNRVYQQLLAGTVWQHYQLVITQWPTKPGQFMTQRFGGIYPQDSGQAFPVNGATNTVMETYFQSQADAAGAGGNSCMSCHYGAGISDYSWVLQNRAH